MCAFEFVVGGEGYKLVIGFKTKMQETQPGSRGNVR